jgi:peptidoglycan/LPS O-acetylase OafA/YrhL
MPRWLVAITMPFVALTVFLTYLYAWGSYRDYERRLRERRKRDKEGGGG